MTADYCEQISPGVIVCGTRMAESDRLPEREAWCFRCRKRRQFVRVVMVPNGMSYYGPTVDIRCGSCGLIDGDLFPGRYREWMEDW